VARARRGLVTTAAPAMLARLGVGVEVTGQLLTTVGDNPDRMRSEAAIAHLCGVAPIPASSGKTRRHRLNRGGDRAANNAVYTPSCSPACASTIGPAHTSRGVPPKA
jgi:transposase